MPLVLSEKRANPRKSDILREVRSRTGLAGSQRVCCFHFSCCKPRDHFGLVKTRRQATKVTKQHVQRLPGSFVVEQRNSSLKRFSKLTCEAIPSSEHNFVVAFGKTTGSFPSQK